MRQVWITKAGGVDTLKIREEDDPKPRRGELLIRVKATGVNFADVLARQGLYPDAPKIPCVVGYEVSGVVETVGEGVDEAMMGKAVLALTRFGGYSDVVAVPERRIFGKPASLSFEQAAAIPVNYLTAYQLVSVMGGLHADESILIHNAGGGVGLAALDIAGHIGATIYGTASGYKHAFLRERGLGYAIDYRQSDWVEELDRLTQGRGVELILDPLGGANWKKSYRALRSTGRLGMFGVSTVTESGLFGKLKFLSILIPMPRFNPLALMNSNKGSFGVNMGNLWHEGEKIEHWMRTILQGLDEGWVRPHVDKVFPFDAAGEAHAHIEARKNIGKVVLVP